MYVLYHVPDCYSASASAGDATVLEQLKKFQGHIVKYPLESFSETRMRLVSCHTLLRERVFSQAALLYVYELEP